MNAAKPGNLNVQTGSVGDPAKGGSGNPGSPTEPTPKAEGLQMSAELKAVLEPVLQVVKQQTEQINQLVGMNSESQRIIGKLGNEVGQLRRQQPAITPEMRKQYKGMLESEETALEAVQLVAGNQIKMMVGQENALLDSYFQARQTDASFASVPFDEYKWQAMKAGVPLENLAEPDNAKVLLRQIVSSRPVDIEAVKAAARAEGAKAKEDEFATILKEKGVAGLVLPSSNGNLKQQQATTEPLSESEESDRIALLMAIGARQITKESIPQEKMLRYGIA